MAGARQPGANPPPAAAAPLNANNSGRNQPTRDDKGDADADHDGDDGADGGADNIDRGRVQPSHGACPKHAKVNKRQVIHMSYTIPTYTRSCLLQSRA